MSGIIQISRVIIHDIANIYGQSLFPLIKIKIGKIYLFLKLFKLCKLKTQVE